MLGSVFFVEVLLVHAIGIPLHGDGTPLQVRQQRGRDARVVIDHLALGETCGRIQNLVEIRQVQPLAFHVHDRRNRQAASLRHHVTPLPPLSITMVSDTMPLGRAAETKLFWPMASDGRVATRRHRLTSPFPPRTVDFFPVSSTSNAGMLSVNPCPLAGGGTMKQVAVRTFALVLFLSAVAAAQDVASFEKRTTVKTLSNGLTVVILERPEAPVFSFFTHVDAGSAQDPMGKTGLAHMFEHMAFKGTDKIGTTDYRRREGRTGESRGRLRGLHRRTRQARWPRRARSSSELEKAWKDAIAEAEKYVKPQRIRRDRRARGRRRHERLHQRRRDRLLLLAARPTGWSCGPISNRSASCIP